MQAGRIDHDQALDGRKPEAPIASAPRRRLIAAVALRTRHAITATVRRTLERGSCAARWYRGLAQGSEADLRAHVQSLLRTHKVNHIVVGHTTSPGAIVPRFGGSVLLIDVGLSQHYGARPACLVVERRALFALHRGRLLLLPPPRPDTLLAYLRTAASLDPAPSPLESLIEAEGRLPLPASSSERR